MKQSQETTRDTGVMEGEIKLPQWAKKERRHTSSKQNYNQDKNITSTEIP